MPTTTPASVMQPAPELSAQRSVRPTGAGFFTRLLASVGGSAASANTTPAPLQFTADVQLTAAAAPAEGEEPKRPTFSIDAYSGGPMRVRSMVDPVIVDLRGIKAAGKTIPILMDHDLGRPVGQANEITIDASGIKLAGVITGDDADTLKLTTHAKNGFRWQASIGATPERREYLAPGKTASVNGRTVTGPMVIVRAATLFETSFTALGADTSTSANIAAKQTGATTMPEQITQQDNAADQLRANAADEFDRIAQIQTIAAAHPQIAAEAVRDGWDLNQTQLAVLRAKRPAAGISNAASRPEIGQVLACSIALAAGINEKTVAAGEPEAVMNEALSARHRGASLQSAFRAVLAHRGETVDRFTDSAIRAAFEASAMLQASGFTTLSLPGLLGNVANKALLAQYEATAAAWRSIAGIRSANDFKEHTSYRLTGKGRFEEVGPDGELKHVGLQEESYSNQVKTRGAIVALTRTHIVNDDLGAFLSMPKVLGRMSVIAIERAVFTALLANTGSFFASGNKNLLTGASSALGIDSLSSAEQLFLQQKDDNGDPILISPDRIVVPPSLSAIARQIVRSVELGVTDGTATGNPHHERFTVHVAPYLGEAAGLDNASDAGWYLLGNPANLAVVEVSFLNGQQMPIIEGGSTDFDTLGMAWRGVYDFGVSLSDKLAGVMSEGE